MTRWSLPERRHEMKESDAYKAAIEMPRGDSRNRRCPIAAARFSAISRAQKAMAVARDERNARWHEFCVGIGHGGSPLRGAEAALSAVNGYLRQAGVSLTECCEYSQHEDIGAIITGGEYRLESRKVSLSLPADAPAWVTTVLAALPHKLAKGVAGYARVEQDMAADYDDIEAPSV